MSNYWLVGAMPGGGGEGDRFKEFTNGGFWSGWQPGTYDKESRSTATNEDIEKQQAKFKEIKKGDKIAIKKMLGQGATDIEIRAIGIVTGTDTDPKKWRIDVKWLDNFKPRRVPIHGATRAINGPYTPDEKDQDKWVLETFEINH